MIEIPSRRYGRYMLRSRLGVGGMAEVFLAEVVNERGEAMSVAVKMLRKGLSEEQFASEADLMSLLSHPNLVRMLEVGIAFARPFIAMEYFIGGDLRAVMDSHRQQMRGFPLSMGVHIVLEVLKALAYFHQAKARSGAPLNLVHSDINPANVFFSGQGEVKLGDYGVTSSSRADMGPGEGVAAGKLWYLSPEQTRGDTLTPASDLWAVGVVLHELVVGYHPFMTDGAEQGEAMNLIRTAKLSIPDYVDKPLAAVLQRALAPDLRQRYRTAGEFAGPLFTYALDHDLLPTAQHVQEWLTGTLEILS